MKQPDFIRSKSARRSRCAERHYRGVYRRRYQLDGCTASLAAKDRQGFTLIELMIVVLVLSIMAAVATPKFAESIARHRVEVVARRLVADLALARRHAKVEGTSRSVEFTVGTNSYRLPGIADLDHPGSDYSVNLSTATDSIGLLSANFNGNSTITFNLYGQPDNAGTVVVGIGSEQRTIVVNPTTGKASVQ